MNKLIIGYVQGDGYITPNGSLQVQHSSKQKEFVDWLYQSIDLESKGKPPKIILSKPHLITGKVYESYRFYTKNVFKSERFYLYPNGIKIIPDDISIYLSPLALAVWFMSDGSKMYNTVRISTNSYSLTDIYIQISALKYNFNIDATIHITNKNTNSYIIYINQSSYLTFKNVIFPYIIPSMLYKLP